MRRRHSWDTCTDQFVTAPTKAKRTPIKATMCLNCNDSPVPHRGYCTECRDRARIEIHYRVVIFASGANIRVCWEMLIDPHKTIDDELSAEDVFVLYEEQAIIDQIYNPNPHV